MDVIPVCAGLASGHRRFSVVGQVGVGAQVPNGLVHAGGKPRRWSVQKRDIRGRSQPPVIDQGRGWFARATGEWICEVIGSSN